MVINDAHLNASRSLSLAIAFNVAGSRRAVLQTTDPPQIDWLDAMNG